MSKGIPEMMYTSSMSTPNECRALRETTQSKRKAAATEKAATLETASEPEKVSLSESKEPDIPTNDQAAA
tara:strand:+ start:617 stop:826 length:210 start_codon:yes stop_codon:yes gene_type:complete